ncbi:murein hydrolase activator EnvC family protein [Halomonas shantousis]
MLLVGCAGGTRPGGSAIGGNWVTIQRGDTLGALARRADVPLARLQRFNPGVDARRLAIGQRILIPTRNERAPSGGPYRYQVRPGDTYSSIARRFGSQTAYLQAANRGTDPNALKVGQLIQVPLRSGAPPSSRPRPASVAKAAPVTRPDPGPLPGSAKNWPWPLDDYKIARRFGPDSRGTLQPMLLTTKSGSIAKSVAAGTVRFANTMRQLDHVVIIHHADNLQSVYALCATLKVKEGEHVKQGTPVCEVGRNSSTERYDLLFDLRHGGKPIDPLRMLR